MINKINILRSYLFYKKLFFSNKNALDKFQNKRIKSHIKYVTNKSSFYKDYRGKELKDFPVVNKQIMMENFYQLNTVGLEKESAMDFAIKAEKERNFKPRINNITVGLSSGTSNTRGIFILSDKEIEMWAGFILAKVVPGQLLKKHNIAFFMRANSNLYEAVNSGKINFAFFDIFKPMEENIERLNNYSPDIIVGQPSVLKELCTAVSSNKLNVKPVKVISIAEVLEEKDSQIIKDTFKLNKIDQVYQCTEGCLGVTCKCGNIHLNEELVYIEKEYLDDKRFIPVITDFNRTSQPIIRYRLNDILVESKTKCECGSVCTVIEKIEGREDDIFTFEDNNGKLIKVFPDAIRRCIMFSGDIDNYRVVQNKDSTIQIFVDCNEKLKQNILKSFTDLASDTKFVLPAITFTDYCYDKNKKLKRVESFKN